MGNVLVIFISIDEINKSNIKINESIINIIEFLNIKAERIEKERLEKERAEKFFTIFFIVIIVLIFIMYNPKK